jgi:hypothetical protein
MTYVRKSLPFGALPIRDSLGPRALHVVRKFFDESRTLRTRGQLQSHVAPERAVKYAREPPTARSSSLFGPSLDLPTLIFPIVLMTLPAAIAVAVLKYRLYDISIIINKTLVYVLLSAILGAVYLGLVFLMRAAPRRGGSRPAYVRSPGDR